MEIVVLLLLLAGAVIIGVPIAFAMGASGIVYLLWTNPDIIAMMPQRIWAGADNFVIVAMPLFVLAGELMNSAGITKRVIDMSMYFIRPIRGGLGEVTVVASMIFGGISGSSVADASALGSVLIPEMERRGYPTRLASGLVAGASTMGMIIPPSIPMIIYALVCEESVGSLFISTLVPGALIGLVQLMVIYYISHKNNYHPVQEKIDWKLFFKTAITSLPAILLPVVLIFTIVTGIATCTESAAVAVFCALFLGFFVYKELTLKHVWVALRKTFVLTSAVMLIVGFSNIYTWILSLEQIPQALVSFLGVLNLNKHVFLFVFLIAMLFLGTFLDVVPTLLLVSPIMIPIVATYGIGKMQFGAIMIVSCAIGLITPPVGMCLNACNKINKLPLYDIFKGAVPFLICDIIVLLMVTYIPELSTYMPSIFKY